MKTKRNKILTLVLASVVAFGGIGKTSLLVVNAEGTATEAEAENEMVTLTLDAGEGTFKENGTNTKIITIKKGTTIESSGQKVPEVNPPEGQKLGGWYWIDTDVSDISKIPFDSSCKITVTYSAIHNPTPAQPADPEVINDKKEEKNVKEDLNAKKENVRKLLNEIDEEVRAFAKNLLNDKSDDDNETTGWTIELTGKEGELDAVKDEKELEALKDSIELLAMEHKLNIAKSYAKKMGEDSAVYKKIEKMHQDIKNKNIEISKLLEAKQYSDVKDKAKEVREKYSGMETEALNDDKLADLLKLGKNDDVTELTPEKEEPNNNNATDQEDAVTNVKEDLKTSVDKLKQLIGKRVDIKNCTPDSVVNYQLVLVKAKKGQMNLESLLAKPDVTEEQLKEGKVTADQLITELTNTEGSLKHMSDSDMDSSTAKERLQAEIGSLEKFLEEKIESSFYTPESIFLFDNLKNNVKQELDKAKRLLEEENPASDRLQRQWWNLSYAHTSLKKAAPVMLEEADASEPDKASLKDDVQKLEDAVAKTEDITRATPESADAYTKAQQAGAEALAKAKEIEKDAKAKKIAVYDAKKAVADATEALEKAKEGLVFLKDSEIYKPVGKDVTVTKGSMVQAKDFIGNLADLPDVTAFAFAGEAPSTDTETDKQNVKITATYADDSISEIMATLTVLADDKPVMPVEIASIEISGNEMEIAENAEKSFKLVYKDENNQVIERNDVVVDVTDVIDPSGTSITASSDKMEVLQNYDDLTLLDVVITDGNLTPGTYIVVIEDNQNRKEYRLPIEFYATNEKKEVEWTTLIPAKPIEKDTQKDNIPSEQSQTNKSEPSPTNKNDGKVDQRPSDVNKKPSQKNEKDAKAGKTASKSEGESNQKSGNASAQNNKAEVSGKKSDNTKSEVNAKSASPKTGDTAPVLPLAGSMLGGIILSVVLLFNRKRYGK